MAPCRSPRSPPTDGAAGAAITLLSFAAGCMDIVSYRLLGNVFTSAMTGNTALLGLDLGQGNLVAAPRNLTAFVGFVAGLAIGTSLLPPRPTARPAPSGRLGAAQRPLRVEAALLIIFTALWFAAGGPATGELRYGLIALSALAMGTQTAAAYHVNLSGLSTTYFTGTLNRVVATALGRTPSAAGGSAPHDLRWLAAGFLAYVAGAAAAGFLLLAPPAALAAAVGWLPANGLPALPAVVVAIVVLHGRIQPPAGDEACAGPPR